MRVLIGAIVVALLASGCSDSGSGNGGLSPAAIGDAIHALNIAGAQGLVLTGEAPDGSRSRTARQGSEETLEANSVYKVAADGRLERVPVEDAAGNELPRGTVRPVGVRELSPGFVAMAFYVQCYSGSWNCDQDDFEHVSNDVLTFVVHKESGLAYRTSHIDGSAFGEEGLTYLHPLLGISVNGDPNEALTVTFDTRRLRHDADENLYVLDSNYSWEEEQWRNTVYRFDMDTLGADTLTVTGQAAFPGDEFSSFEVHPGGGFFVYYGTREGGSANVRRLNDLATGTFWTINTVGDGETDLSPMQTTLRGHDGELYLVAAEDSDSGSVYRAFQLGLDQAGPTVVEVDLDVEGGFISSALNVTSTERRLVGGRPFYFNQHVAVDSAPVEFDTSVQPHRLVRHSDSAGRLDDILQQEISENYLWYRGTAGNDDLIVRYDPATRETAEIAVTLEGGGALQIDRFQILAADRVLFEGTRSDQAQVRGEVSLDGTVIVHEVIDPAAPIYLYLEPIRPVNFIAIDGNPQEWPIATRVLFGEAGSGPAGDDLLFYSEQSGNGRYYGLVEFEGGIDPNHWTVIHLSQTHRVAIREGAARLVHLPDDVESLIDAGGRFAVGEAVEFYLPLDALDTLSPTASRVERRVDTGSGPDMASDPQDVLQ